MAARRACASSMLLIALAGCTTRYEEDCMVLCGDSVFFHVHFTANAQDVVSGQLAICVDAKCAPGEWALVDAGADGGTWFNGSSPHGWMTLGKLNETDLWLQVKLGYEKSIDVRILAWDGSGAKIFDVSGWILVKHATSCGRTCAIGSTTVDARDPGSPPDGGQE